MKEPDITDYNYIGSAIGNAYFSGVSYDQLWLAIRNSESREELDASIDALIQLNKLLKKG